MNNILAVVFDPESSTARASGLWQYDYGQVLRIQGLDLPKAAEIHFSLDQKSGESIARIGTTKDGVTDAPIPDSVLEYNTSQNYNIYAFIFLSDTNSGNTEYRITIPVKARPKPEVPGDPEEPELFREAIEAVNQAADQSEEARNQAEAWAHGRDDYPEQAKDNAKYYAFQATKSAEDAEQAKTDTEKLAESIKKTGTGALKNIQDQEDVSKQNIISYADDEINRINQNVDVAEENLHGTIRFAGIMQQELEDSTSQAKTMKTAVNQSTEAADTVKQDLDTSITEAEKAGKTLAETINTANISKTDLNKAIQDASMLDDNLKTKITEGTTLNKTLQATGEKTVSDIQTEADTQLQRVQTAADAIEADREQIRKNKEDIATKANQTTFAKTDRKLNALWKLNQGISYQFEEDSEPAYQKVIPTGAKMASVKQIGGKTIVWNQLMSKLSPNTLTSNGVTITMDNDTVTIAGTPTGIVHAITKNDKPVSIIENHKYLCILNTGSDDISIGVSLFKSDYSIVASISRANAIWTSNKTVEGMHTRIEVLSADIGKDISIDSKIQLFDLTKMFGAGNEPSTVEKFEAIFSEGYYPYNKGTLLSMPVNEVMEQGKNLINIPDGQATSQKYYDVEIPRDVQITVSSKIARSDGRLSRIRLDYKIDEEWKYCAGNSVVSGLSYVTAVIPQEANNTRIAFQFLDNISGTLAYKDTQIELGLKPTAYMPYKELAFSTIPQVILDLPGYGLSAGNVYNYVDWENKKYIQRVTAVDLGSLNYNSGEYENHKYFNTMGLANMIKPDTTNTLCNRYVHATANSVLRQNDMEIIVDTKAQLLLRDDSMNQDTALLKNTLSGVNLYYELAEPIVTNIAEIIPEDFLEAMEVEAGGSLTFQNSNGDNYKVPVPNTVEYAVKLSEVAE